MALAKQTVGNTPSEFGGIPGLYGNIDEVEVVKETTRIKQPYDKANPIEPHQTRSSLTQTDSTDPTDAPRYGDGGVKVA